MPPPRTGRSGSPAPPARFSQANKLCFRATPAQSAWLAQHMAASELSISRVLRDAIDLYITAQPSQTHSNLPHQEPAC